MVDVSKTVGWWLMLVLAALISAYAVAFAFFEPVGDSSIKAKLFSYPFASYLHILPGALALLIGPLQLHKRFRTKHLNLHRFLGKVYLCAVITGGCGGLYLAFYSDGGLVTHFGFGILALLWLYTAIQAYLSIRRGNVMEHQRWMVRNYALTLAGVSLRLLLGVFCCKRLQL